MTDFTQNLNASSKDFTQTLEAPVETSTLLGDHEAGVVTAFTQNLFENSEIAITTRDELKEVNNAVKADIEAVSKEADVESVYEMVANGDIKDPTQAQALLQTLEEDKETVGENTALLSASINKARNDAIANGSVVDIRDTQEYKEAYELLSKGNYGSTEHVLAKMAVLQQVLAEVEDNQSDIAAVGAQAMDVLIPTADAIRSYKGSISETPAGFFTNRTLEDVKVFDTYLLDPTMSPEDLYLQLSDYVSKHDPETAKQKLRSISQRSLNSDQAWFLFDVGTLGAASASGLAKGVKTTIQAGKVAGASIPATIKAATKEGLKGALKEAAKEVPGLTTTTVSLVDITKHPSKLKKLVGNRKDFAKTVANGLSDSAFEDPSVSRMFIEEGLNSAVSPRLTLENVTQVSNTAEVASAKESLAATNNLQQYIWKRGGKVEEMSEQALEALKKQAAENFAIDHPGAKLDYADLEQFEVTPIKHTSGKTGKDVYRFRYRIGTGPNNAQPFVSKEAAEKYAKDLKVKAASTFLGEDIGKDAAGWWISITTESTDSLGDVAARAFEEQAAERGLKVTEKATKNKALGVFGGSTARSTAERRLTALAAHERDNVMLPLLLDAQKSINSLNRTDAKIFEDIVGESRRNRKWVSLDYLRENGASEKLINAYTNYRAINDLEYLVANRNLAKELTERGAKEVFLDGNRQGYEYLRDGEEIKNLDDMWFRVDGEEVPRKLTKEEYAALKKQGYRFTETPYSYKDIQAKKIRKAYNPSRFNEKAINPANRIIDYVPGGRYKYSADNIFIKQLDVAEGTPTAKGSSRKYISGVHTITAGTSIDDANLYARMLEEARQVWIGFESGRISSQAATQVLQNGLGSKAAWGGSIESVSEWMKAHKISKDPEAVIEAVKDGEKLKSYSSIMSKNVAVDLLDSDTAFRRSGSSLFTSEQEILKRMRKEGDIEEIFEGFTPVRANPEEELKKLVNEISNITTMKNYAALYRDNFKRVYADVIADIHAKNFKLTEGVLKSAEDVADKDLLASARNSIKQYEAIRSVPNKFDEAMLEMFDGVLRALHVSEDGIQKIHDFDTLAKTRRVVSFFNFAFAPAQLLRQAMGITSAHLLNPVASVQADILMFLYPIFKEGTPKMIEAGLKTFGLEKAADNLGTFFKNVDFLRSRGTYYEAGVLSTGLDTKRTLTKAGYLPYITGETINRVHSSIVSLLSSSPNRALGSTLATFHNKYGKINLEDVGGAEMAELVNRYQRYYMNMDAVGKAPIQNSQVYQTALQFQSYKLKWWETLADQELTKIQKGSFLLGNIFLYGTVGFGLGNVFSDDTGLGEALNEGFLNYSLNALFGDREFLPDLNELGSATPLDLFDYGLHLGENMVNLPLVRAGSQTINTASRILDAASNLFTLEDYSYEAFLEDMKMLIVSKDNPFTGVARTQRAAEAFYAGSLKNTRGIVSANKMSDVDAILYGLGFNNLRDSQMYRKFQDVSGAKEDVNQIIKDLTPYYLNMINNPDDNTARIVWRATAYNLTQNLSMQARREVNQGLTRELRNRHKDSFERFKEAKVREMKLEPQKTMFNKE